MQLLFLVIVSISVYTVVAMSMYFFWASQQVSLQQCDGRKQSHKDGVAKVFKESLVYVNGEHNALQKVDSGYLSEMQRAVKNLPSETITPALVDMVQQFQLRSIQSGFVGALPIFRRTLPRTLPDDSYRTWYWFWFETKDCSVLLWLGKSFAGDACNRVAMYQVLYGLWNAATSSWESENVDVFPNNSPGAAGNTNRFSHAGTARTIIQDNLLEINFDEGYVTYNAVSKNWNSPRAVYIKLNLNKRAWMNGPDGCMLGFCKRGLGSNYMSTHWDKLKVTLDDGAGVVVSEGIGWVDWQTMGNISSRAKWFRVTTTLNIHKTLAYLWMGVRVRKKWYMVFGHYESRDFTAALKNKKELTFAALSYNKDAVVAQRFTVYIAILGIGKPKFSDTGPKSKFYVPNKLRISGLPGGGVTLSTISSFPTAVPSETRLPRIMHVASFVKDKSGQSTGLLEVQSFEGADYIKQKAVKYLESKKIPASANIYPKSRLWAVLTTCVLLGLVLLGWLVAGLVYAYRRFL